MVQPNTDQWLRICNAFETAVKESGERRFALQRLAMHVRKSMLERVQCRDEVVSHYAYTLDDMPKYDSFKVAKSPTDSVVLSNDVWTFGLGVTVEIAENAWPKNTLVFPVMVEYRDTEFDLSGPLLRGDITVKRGDTYQAGIDDVAVALWDGIEEVVEAWASGKTRQRVGFDSQDLTNMGGCQTS
jgi:hypothetical protein